MNKDKNAIQVHSMLILLFIFMCDLFLYMSKEGCFAFVIHHFILIIIKIISCLLLLLLYIYTQRNILQDSKRYLKNPTVQVQPQLTSN